MRRPTVIFLRRPVSLRHYATSTSRPPIIRIDNGTFYRHHPNSNHADANANPPLFKNLNFEIASFSSEPQYWSILGPSSSGKTTFLNLLRGKHLCIPPTARSYPYLESDEIELKHHRLRNPDFAIRHVGFDGEQGIGAQAPQSAYLSARYESRREVTDYSVLNYLEGNTELNPSQNIYGRTIDPTTLNKVIKDLRLGDLVDMPVSNLSNGQTRRARIAKALLREPEVLLLDEPFMGLDPPTLLTISPMLERLAKANAPRLVLALRPQDPIPDWITHLIYLKGSCDIAYLGKKQDVLRDLHEYVSKAKRGEVEADMNMPLHSMHEIGRMLTSHEIIDHAVSLPQRFNSSSHNTSLYMLDDNSSEIKKLAPSDSWRYHAAKEMAKTDPGDDLENPTLSRDGYDLNPPEPTEISDPHMQPTVGEALVEMEGVRVTYGTKSVLGNWQQKVGEEVKDGLWWTIKRGERVGVFGPNGSGKTTLLSLICSDHPQTYSLPIRLFGRPRIPEAGQRGISIFDIQARIGHSSPEIHNHIPRSLTLRHVLENAWSDTFRGVPKLDISANQRIDACLRWFEQDLRPGAGAAENINRELKDCQSRSRPLEGKDLQNLVACRNAIKPAWADELVFGGLPFSCQRVALFLRAIIKKPDLVILDEAFSGMDDGVRDRCLLFLARGQTKQYTYTTIRDISASKNHQGDGRPLIVESDISKVGEVIVHGLSSEQALLCISHVREEIPGSIREWICLPEANTCEPARFGRLRGPIEGDYRRWNEIWGMNVDGEPM